MIKKIISNIYQSNYLKPRVYLLSSNKSSNSGINQNSLTQNNSNEIIEDTQPGKLMQDNYQKIKLPGLYDRDLTDVSDFQKQIIEKNKFDLMNPNIIPKMATTKTNLGLKFSQNQYLTEIDIGKVKVKTENQIFLSEVDPNNIPEYYQIIFDESKTMTLVGKKVKDGIAQPTMSIAPKSFQQKTESQISRQILGFSGYQVYKFKTHMKRFIWGFFVAGLIYIPFNATPNQLSRCINSILEIQNQKLKQLNQLKRNALTEAIFLHPDFH